MDSMGSESISLQQKEKLKLMESSLQLEIHPGLLKNLVYFPITVALNLSNDRINFDVFPHDDSSKPSLRFDSRPLNCDDQLLK